MEFYLQNKKNIILGSNIPNQKLESSIKSLSLDLGICMEHWNFDNERFNFHLFFLL